MVIPCFAGEMGEDGTDKAVHEGHATAGDVVLRARIPAKSRVAAEVPLEVVTQNRGKTSISCLTGFKYMDYEINVHDSKNLPARRTRFGERLVDVPVRTRAIRKEIGAGKQLGATIFINRMFELPPGDYVLVLTQTVTVNGQSVGLSLKKLKFEIVEENELSEAVKDLEEK